MGPGGCGRRAAARSQLLVLDPVRSPRQGRLLRAALGLRGFREELEDGREALPRSELVTVGACGNTHRVTRGRTGVARGGEPALHATAPPSASSPGSPAQVPPVPGVPGARRLAHPHPRPASPGWNLPARPRVSAGAPGARGPQSQSRSSAGRATPSPAQKPPTSPGLGLVSPTVRDPDSTTPTRERLAVLASRAEWGE